MARLEVSARTHVAAPPAVVYGIFADYHVKHPSVLPPGHLFDLVVEEGGTGAGTVFRIKTQALGQTRALRAVVSEPEPGRVLVERELPEGKPGGITTTFRVEPAAGGSQVTITTEWTRAGLGGLVDRLLTVPAMRRIYEKEMALVAQVARAEADRPS